MSISLVPAGIRVAGQNLLSGFPPPCALRLRERMYFFATVPARLDLGLPRRTALQGFAGIRVHSRAKICFPVFPLRVLCGSVRGCIFFVTAPARLNLGLPRRTALQGFAGICVHSRAKFSGLRSQIPGFFPSGEPRLGIDSNRESHPTKISFAKDMTRGERTCMDSR
jgi:hypothetical protein